MMKMYMDFSAILAIATVVSGLIWLADILFFKAKRLARDPSAQEPKLVEYAHSFFPILLIVFILRSFLIEPFRIPSGSMKPTLLEGDFILVNKYTYGLRMPLLGKEFLAVGTPKRGDILIFRYPKNTSIDFIKRVVGLPGDKIRYENKTIYLNGKPLAQSYVGTNLDSDQNGQLHEVKWFNEQLDQKNHAIYVHNDSGRPMEEITVPPGHYFVMGDNRDNSEDSRVWGFVPESLILGKAVMIWMSWDQGAKDVRWARIGKSV